MRTRRVLRTQMALPKPAMDYRSLVLDPCNGPLIGPVGAGVGTGLFARYKKIITPTIDADTNTFEAVAQIDPLNHVIKVGVAATPSATFTVTDYSTDVGILAPAVAQGYRIIASCIKWVPTGSLLYRKGIVRSIASPEGVGVASGNMDNISTLASHSAFNGSEDHEVVYFPSEHDLPFLNPADVINTQSGTTIAVAVSGIDCTYAGLPSGTTAASGYFEVTWVAEWMPARGTNMSTAPLPPTSVTLAQLYDTIKPFASAAVNMGVRMALLRAQGYMARAAAARLTG